MAHVPFNKGAERVSRRKGERHLLPGFFGKIVRSRVFQYDAMTREVHFKETRLDRGLFTEYASKQYPVTVRLDEINAFHEQLFFTVRDEVCL